VALIVALCLPVITSAGLPLLALICGSGGESHMQGSGAFRSLGMVAGAAWQEFPEQHNAARCDMAERQYASKFMMPKQHHVIAN
jgi:hypothetical protein